VPADCRIVEAVGLEMDEANLTGESLPVAKTAQPSAARVPADRVSMVYEGTAVAAGHGLATVVATGPDTEARRAEQLAHPPRPGAVHDRLNQLTKSTLPLSVGAGVLLLGANLLRGQSMSQGHAAREDRHHAGTGQQAHEEHLPEFGPGDVHGRTSAQAAIGAAVP
jgi:magnesium-transporting ATPase (P-type)